MVDGKDVRGFVQELVRPRDSVTAVPIHVLPRRYRHTPTELIRCGLNPKQTLNPNPDPSP